MERVSLSEPPTPDLLKGLCL